MSTTHRFTFARTLLLCALLLCSSALCAPPPRLVVVISLDQFPYEYLARFRDHFGSGGFRRLLEGGAVFTNAVYKHAANLTGPGHAVILSGTYGNSNGIITNNWYDLCAHAPVYCVSDSSVNMVGGAGPGYSPALFLGSTFGDELRIASGFRSRTISLSHKNRAAILLGGKLANAAYWMSDSSFVTSTYYLPVLPSWVQDFNRSGLITSFFKKFWQQSLPESAFEGLDIDNARYEGDDHGYGRTFPHRLAGDDTARLSSSYFHNLICSPYGSEVLAAFAKAAVHGEQLGARGVTDLLCVSFSSTDYVGHAFGPQSREVLEMTVRMDSTLSDFLNFLDREMGSREYLLALTSDHGVAPIPEFLTSHHAGADAGRVSSRKFRKLIERSLNERYGEPPPDWAWIEHTVDRNVYFNRETLAKKKVSPADAARVAAEGLRTHPAVAAVFTREQLSAPSTASALEQAAARSYHPLRSGDLCFILKAYYLEGSGDSGTSHGDPYSYNAHVPLILYGAGVRAGVFTAETSPADLAPTLSVIMGVEFPAGREGRVLGEAIR